MKKSLVLLASFLLLFLSSKSAFAAAENYRFTEVSQLNEDEEIIGNYFATGEKVVISGHVLGDTYAAGGNITVDGIIDGDLIVVGGNILIQGTINQDLRVAGGDVTINGQVIGNITSAGGNINFSNNATVGGSITAFAGNLNIDSEIGGGVEAFVGNFNLLSNSKIGGDINYWSEDDVNTSSGALVIGSTTKQAHPNLKMNWQPEEGFRKFMAGLNTFGTISSILTTLILGFLAIKMFPKFMRNGAQILSTQFTKSLGLGFVTVIFIPMLIVILAITFFGLPLAVLLTFAMVITFYFVRLYTLVALGVLILKRLSPKKLDNNLLVFAVGTAAYYIIGMLPIVGGIFILLSFLASLGASILNKKHFYSKLQSIT